MKTIVIDCAELTDKEKAQSYLKNIFAFPEYYGCNLDALYDMLTMLPQAEWKITFTHEKALKPESYAMKVVETIREAIEDNQI